MNAKRLACALVLVCVLFVGRAQAAPEPPKLTLDNFVSLTWSVASRTDENQESDKNRGFDSSAWGNRTRDYVADKNSIALLPESSGPGGSSSSVSSYNPPTVKPLSVNQFEALVRALQSAKPARTADDANSKVSPQTFVLTLSDAKNLDQSFAIGGRELSDYLLALARSKGLAQGVAEPSAESKS